MHCARCSILSYTRCNSAVSILRIDTAELLSRVWQYAAACTKVHWRTRRSFSAPFLTSKYFAFAWVRDLRPRWSTRWQTGFSCATLYKWYSYLKVITYLYLWETHIWWNRQPALLFVYVFFLSCVRKDAVERLVANTLRALNRSISGNLSGTHNIFLTHII